MIVGQTAPKINNFVVMESALMRTVILRQTVYLTLMFVNKTLIIRCAVEESARRNVKMDLTH